MQLPAEGDEKLKAAFEAALEGVTKQRLERGESLDDPDSDINEGTWTLMRLVYLFILTYFSPFTIFRKIMHLEEQSLDASKKRGGKLEEKVETKRNGQKDFVVGDIVLVNWFGYAEWPAVVKK